MESTRRDAQTPGPNKYRQLLEAFDEGFCILQMIFDEAGRPVDYLFLETNPAFERHTGLKDAEGRRARELVPNLDDSWFNIYGEVALTGETRRFENYAPAMSRWFEVVATRTGEPEDCLVALLFTDITKRKEAEQQLYASEKRMQELFDHAPAFMTVLKGEQLIFEKANRPYLQLIGWRDIQGRPLLEALPEVADHPYIASIRHVMASGETVEGRGVPVNLQRVPGEPPEERIVDFVYMPLQEADGSISGVFVHGVDLTERVKAEKEAEEAWEWLRRVADTTPDIIFILNIVENRNVYANRSLLTCLGYDPDSFTAVDNVLERVLVPEDVNEAERFYREMASANPGEVRLFTNRAYHRDGSIRWIENRVSPFRWDDNGTLLEVIGVATDVTDRMEVEARLRTSEARYRAIVESQSEMVSRFRLDGTLLFVNGAYARSRGTTPDAIIGGNFWEWIPEEEHASVREMLTRLTPDSPEVRIENQFHTAEGVRWTLWTNRALEFDEDGRPLEFQSAGIDITDLKLAEEARRQSEDLVRTIAENSTQGLAMMDEHGYCTYANKAWLEMTGYTAEEIGSKPLHYLVHHHYPDGRPYPKEECPLDRALPENFDVRAHEDLFFRKDGSSFPVMCAASPIFEEGRPVATVIEIRDVTAAKQAEEELRRSRDELEQRVRERTAELEAANREMESFNYSIAHDLRGPLRAIVATSAMLLADAGPKLTEDERQELVTQQEAAKKLARLIDDLLHLSRLSRQPVVKAPFDLSVLVHEVLREMGAKALARHKIQVEPGMIAVGDQGLIKLVLHNLIENSIKYSPDGGRIEIGRHRDAFFVRDQGIGFDMQYAHKLFMPFERLHREEEYPGSGIGLASVKRIVERHGGKVWAESAPANGAAFYFTLPPNGQ